MSTAEKQKYNAIEYLERERAATTRSEYYQGEVFSMAGASREHNLIVRIGCYFAKQAALSLSAVP